MGFDFCRDSELPYNFYCGSAVVYNNKIHILGGGNSSKSHYSWNGTEWVLESELPYDFYFGSAVVYNNKIHILGGNYNSSGYTNHYSWNGTEWISESTLPYDFYSGSAVVYNNKIHILGSDKSGLYTNHYSWDGTEWVSESTLPYNFVRGSAIVYNGKIHILGSSLKNLRTNHYSWNGTEWVSESTLPYNFYSGSAVVYNNKIHISGGASSSKSHYSWNGTEWVLETELPYPCYMSSAVVYDTKIHILGCANSNIEKNHISGYINNGINTVKYGDKYVLDLHLDSLDNSNKLPKNETAHSKYGTTVFGSRPRYFKYESADGKYINDSIKNPSSTEKVAFYLRNTRAVRISTGSKAVYLKATKTDGSTISSVTLCSPSAGYENTCVIRRVRYINASQVMLECYVMTSATARGAIFVRIISMKADGTLVMGASFNISAAQSSDAVQANGVLIKGLYERWINVRWTITKSSGAYAISTYRVYWNAKTGEVNYNSTALVNISSNANAYCPDLTFCPSVGGFFYKNASGTECVCIMPEYNGSALLITLANAGSDIANVGVTDHYILGYHTEGLLVTAKKGDRLYLWYFDPTSTTNNVFELANSISFNKFNSTNRIISFKNNILTMEDGTRYQINFNGSIKELENIESLDTYQYPSSIYNTLYYSGPESDPYEGVFIYGD